MSGGEEGALWGPSIMPGGQVEAWEALAPILRAIAAKAEDGEPCVEYMGPGGAGHFVKMVHNGIEYGDMQLIAESYDLLSRGLGLTAKELHEIFGEWNQGELKSYLIEITAAVLAAVDPDTGRALVDVILDEAQQKGTGKWMSQNALDVGARDSDDQRRRREPDHLGDEGRARGGEPGAARAGAPVHGRPPAPRSTRSATRSTPARSPPTRRGSACCGWRRPSTSTT